MRAVIITAAALFIVLEFVAFLIWLKHEPQHMEED